jgi:phosphatidylglycerol:prolipoprotein diacylglycerol transferase
MLPALRTAFGDVHVTVSLYGVAMLAAVATGMLVALRRARHPEVVLVTAPLVVVASALGAAALYRALDGGSGFASMGGVGAGLAVIVVAGRASGVGATALLDALAPGALVGFGIGRVGCFLGGCCFGRPTTLPWGVVLPELGPPARHPVQLYEAAAVLALCFWLTRREPPLGTTARCAMIGYGLVRIVLECVRDPAATDLVGGGPLTVAQVCGVGLVLGGLVMCAAERGRGGHAAFAPR